MKVKIRKTKTTELSALFDFIRKTFADTYAIHNTKENIVNYLIENLSNEQLTKEYDNSNSQFYLAEYKDEIVGYIKLNRKEAQNELADLYALEIERIYISSKHQKKGLGEQLMTFCKSKCQEENHSYLWLGVWDQNVNAIGFYEHMGFEVYDTHEFLLGDDRQQDYLMKWAG